MAHHDPVTPHNFHIDVLGREGHRVRARVRLDSTIPPGGIELDVLYDSALRAVVEVSPWRNLGQFVTEELDRLARAEGS